MIKSGYSQEDLARMGPDELTKRRLLAEALLSDASKQRKIEHPLQGMAQMAEALMGGLRMRRLDQAQTSGQSAADKVWSGIFGGGGSPAPSSQPSAPNIPMPGAAGEIASTDPIKGDVYGPFMDTIRAGGVNNPYALAAIASTGRAESGWSAKNAGRTWSDPSVSGQPGTAGGIMSWRGPRYQALAATGDLSPQGQAKFFLNEDPGLIQALNKAGSVEEAQRLMNNAWKFAGYDRPGGEAARRLGYAKGYLPEFQGGNEVASLDPSAGAPAGNATAYVDPMVSAPNGGGGFDMGRFGPQMDLTKNPTSPAQLPAELRTQAAALQPPAPVQTPPQQTQVADNAKLGAALTGGGPSQEQLMSIISNPWMSDERKKIAQMLLGQQIEQQNAIRDQQIKQADPAYKLDQEYKRAQLDALRAKPGKNWQKLDDNTLFNPDTGETKAVGTAPGNGGFRFGGNSVEAQALNGLMDSGQLTPEQAQQLGAGKTITGPNGEIIFMTPQGVFGQPANGGPAQPLSLPEQRNGIDLFDERSPAQSAQQSPAAVSPRAAPSGMIPLTEPKTTVDEKKAMTFADRMATSGAIVDRLGNVGTNTGEVLKSRIPLVGNMIVGEDFQKLDQARRDFINAQLRRESGAVISDAEFDNANKQYFPQPGDSEETIRQKAENRRIAVEGMIRDAGPTYKRPDIQTDEGWTELAPGVRIRKVN